MLETSEAISIGGTSCVLLGSLGVGVEFIGVKQTHKAIRSIRTFSTRASQQRKHDWPFLVILFFWMAIGGFLLLGEFLPFAAAKLLLLPTEHQLPRPVVLPHYSIPFVVSLSLLIFGCLGGLFACFVIGLITLNPALRVIIAKIYQDNAHKQKQYLGKFGLLFILIGAVLNMVATAM